MSKVYKVLEDKCVGCKQCRSDCPTGAMTITESGVAYITESCVGCGICLKKCNKGAIKEVESELQTTTCRSCPIYCNIPKGKIGACHRFQNLDGELVRIEPLNIVDKSCIQLDKRSNLLTAPLMLGLGAGTNLYSTGVPARFVGEDVINGVEVVTSVTEAVLSFCGVKVKIDTDENIGPVGSAVKREGHVVGHINATEYGSRTMYIGGAELLTGKAGYTVARTMISLLNKETVSLKTETVKDLVLQEGKPPIVDGEMAINMRVGCGSMIPSGFATHWIGVVDEVIAVDFDITAILSQHTTSGVRYGVRPTGITPVGTYSSPGRYFGTPGNGWGGSNIMNGRDAIASIDKTIAWPGMKIIITEPTAERAEFFVLDESLEPVEQPIPEDVMKVLNLIRQNCEKCLTNVSVVGGFGGGFRGVLSKVSPVNVNKALREGKIMITICGQPVHILPGGGITVETSISKIPPGSFTWVPTPAGVIPVEVTMTKDTYREIGGYLEAVKKMEEIIAENNTKTIKLCP